MNVLIACESSGTVREAFNRLGHFAFSCDLLPADDNSPMHFQMDALECINRGVNNGMKWDLVIAHPPCTYLSSSGLHWNKRMPERAAKTVNGADFFMRVVGACERNGGKWAIENPIGCMSRLYRKPDQIIQPWQFGEDASKATCLWLGGGLKPLRHTLIMTGRLVGGKQRFANQTDSGQNRLSPSHDRWKIRSKTFQGIADAFADQWGNL